MLKLSVALGVLAALADIAGGLVLVKARGVERYLRYFVALGAGFCDQSQFSRHFKRLVGVTPGQFRTPARIV